MSLPIVRMTTPAATEPSLTVGPSTLPHEVVWSARPCNGRYRDNLDVGAGINEALVFARGGSQTETPSTAGGETVAVGVVIVRRR